MNRRRTDLALELADRLESKTTGIVQEREDWEGIRITRIRIETQQCAKQLGKPCGTYLTLETDELLHRKTNAFPRAVRAVAKALNELLNEKERRGTVLVAGLGNRMVTPDAVGPRTTDHVMVTRHLVEMSPEQFDTFHPVSALAAGVLGTTGIESGEVVRGVCRQIHPSAVIAVDALAACSAQRLCSTIQLADTGIIPGSGVGNARTALNQDTLGIPVIAIGVPTVMEAETLALDMTGHPTEGEWENFLITHKDIDVLMNDMAKVIGYGINMALQEDLKIEDMDLFLS